MLVQDLGKYVAISEEFANSAVKKVKSGGLLFDRKVTRIITPGTLIDENFMDPWQSNFLLSVHIDKSSLKEQEIAINDEALSGSVLPKEPAHGQVGLAWLDLSSGDFYTQNTTTSTLAAAVARIGPREVLVDTELRNGGGEDILSMLKDEGHVVSLFEFPSSASLSDWDSMLQESLPEQDAAKFSKDEVTAGGALLSYVRTQIQSSGASMQLPIRYVSQEHMSIDKTTLRALEIRTTLRDGRFEGSLLHSMRKTVTQSGTRLLTQRLSECTGNQYFTLSYSDFCSKCPRHSLFLSSTNV